jgi:hypothetical protein
VPYKWCGRRGGDLTLFYTSIFMYTMEHNVQSELSAISYLEFTAAKPQADKHPEHARHTKILTTEKFEVQEGSVRDTSYVLSVSLRHKQWC